jgi:hypothetical protein
MGSPGAAGVAASVDPDHADGAGGDGENTLGGSTSSNDPYRCDQKAVPHASLRASTVE